MNRFWYRFVPRNISLIHSGAGERVYNLLETQISAYMGEVFEEICKQFLWHENLADRLPISFRDAGRWWGANPILKSEQEIDIIAYDDFGAIFCECKWTNSPVGCDILDRLIEKCRMFSFEHKFYFIFSKSGFTDECKNIADANIRLICFENMF